MGMGCGLNNGASNLNSLKSRDLWLLIKHLWVKAVSNISKNCGQISWGGFQATEHHPETIDEAKHNTTRTIWNSSSVCHHTHANIHVQPLNIDPGTFIFNLF